MAIPFLFITGLIFIAVGLYGLYDPVAALAQHVGLKLEGIAAYSQMRASAGGVPLLAGGLMLWATKRDDLERAALAVTVVMLGGLELGRWYSVLVDGAPPPTIWFFMAFETLGLVQAAFLFRASAPVAD